jgi:hypothetical protein
MSVGIPGLSMYFDHRQVKPFIKKQSEKADELFRQRVVPAMLQGTCKVLEIVANGSADAHDHLIHKLKAKKSASSPK